MAVQLPFGFARTCRGNPLIFLLGPPFLRGPTWRQKDASVAQGRLPGTMTHACSLYLLSPGTLSFPSFLAYGFSLALRFSGCGLFVFQAASLSSGKPHKYFLERFPSASIVVGTSAVRDSGLQPTLTGVVSIPGNALVKPVGPTFRLALKSRILLTILGFTRLPFCVWAAPDGLVEVLHFVEGLTHVLPEEHTPTMPCSFGGDEHNFAAPSWEQP